MTAERTFLRVPPDSSGKRVRMTHTAQVFYNTKTPGYTWAIGERYTVTYDDDAVYTMHVHGAYEVTSTTGLLEVHVSKAAKYENLSPKVGANIISPTGATAAIVESVRDVYINSNHIIGYDNPEYGVDVDATGSMNIRFPEGRPQLDAFGKLRTSGATILGDYVFSENFLPQYFATTQEGNGSRSYDGDRHSLLLTTGTSTATANTGTGSHYVRHTSHTYHHYFPGFSHFVIMTVALSDEGAAGLLREWGYFDEKNGYYFRVEETDGLQFVIRSSATGVLTETRISKTQTQYWVNGVLDDTVNEGWNGDVVDGTGESGNNLQLSNDNIYWLDIQWLGGGRVRFGTYYQGQRVVVHEYFHEDNDGYPHSQSGSLPVRFTQSNILNQAVPVAGNLRVWCVSVASESDVDIKGQGRGQLETFEVTFDPANLNDFMGMNDTGKGDRGGIVKTGVTTSGNTVTVPDMTGIKPGMRLHLEDANTASPVGVFNGEPVITEIINNTTLKIDIAPTTNFTTGIESIRFHLHVEDEYHLIGILSPMPNIGNSPNSTGVDHVNRTLYLPQAMRALAYHEDGTEAFCEIEVYADPIISGNDLALPTSEYAATQTYGTNAVLTRIERNDPTCGVLSYQNDGRVNYFGGGYHQLATYTKGSTGREDLGSQYTNFQSGAFKLRADNGGNNRCPILKVFQSHSANVATVVQINTPPTGIEWSLHREGNPLEFTNIPGLIGTDATYGINDGGSSGGAGQTFYVRHLSKDLLELYLDPDFQTPWDTSALSNSTNGNSYTWPGNTGSVATGGFILSGYGPYLYFAIVAKPVGPSATYAWYKPVASGGKGPITVHFALSWNEIVQ